MAKCYSHNFEGQIGNNTTTDSRVPAQSNMTSASIPVTNTTYAYNGDGVRMAKTANAATTRFTWDMADGLPLLLVDGTTNYIYGPGGLPLEQITSAGVVTYYHHDQLGSTRALTNSAGTVVATTPTTPTGKSPAPPARPRTPWATPANTPTTKPGSSICGPATTTPPSDNSSRATQSKP